MSMVVTLATDFRPGKVEFSVGEWMGVRSSTESVISDGEGGLK